MNICNTKTKHGNHIWAQNHSHLRRYGVSFPSRHHTIAPSKQTRQSRIGTGVWTLEILRAVLIHRKRLSPMLCFEKSTTYGTLPSL